MVSLLFVFFIFHIAIFKTCIINFLFFFFIHSTESWMVKPLYGISHSNEKEFVLHLNKVSLALAHVNPPRHFLKWDIGEVQNATSKGKNFQFTVVSSSGNSGKCAIGSSLTHTVSGNGSQYQCESSVLEILH